MAAYTVGVAKHATLVASTVDTVTIPAAADEVEVVNRSTGYALYFSTTGTPTVAGDDTFYVGPGEALTVPGSKVGTTVKLISSAACAYSVTVV